MNKWLRRLRGALGLGLTWGIAGFVIGMGIELIHNIWPNPLGSAVDIWPMMLAVPGLLGGVAFSTVLGIAGRRRQFGELSLPRFAVWGAVGGFVVSLIPVAMIAGGLGTSSIPLWQLAAGVAVPCMLGGAVAASGSLMLARLSGDRALRAASEELAAVGLTEEESRELLGEG